jgi:hypothetical protein
MYFGEWVGDMRHGKGILLCDVIILTEEILKKKKKGRFKV